LIWNYSMSTTNRFADYDSALTLQVQDLKDSIKAWGIDCGLWDESEVTFWSYIEYFSDEPNDSPCLLVLTVEGALADFLDGIAYCEFEANYRDILDKQGIVQELESRGVATFWLENENSSQHKAFKEYFEWQWICELVKPEFSELYTEIYDWFSKKPDDFYKLSSRGYEIIIEGILKNNGYRTQLGTGQADGGVDVRLYSNEVIGEAVTLVQAKRYAEHRPIGLEAVQALSAVVEDEKANRGLFLTTSRYLPGVEKFANRQNKKIILANNNDLAEWSKYAHESIVKDKSKLVSREHVKRILLEPPRVNSLEGRIFHANTVYSTTLNSFVIVLRETKTAVLLMALPKVDISGDGQEGYEIPVRDVSSLKMLIPEAVFRAQKKLEGTSISLWGDRNLYHLWDEKPQFFSWVD